MGERPPAAPGRGSAGASGAGGEMSRPLARTKRSMAGDTAGGSEVSDGDCPALAAGLTAAGAGSVVGVVSAGR
jgi:hypothetical protein